jgi:hypothetical protein
MTLKASFAAAACAGGSAADFVVVSDGDQI